MAEMARVVRLEKQRLTGLEVVVTGVHDEAPPWTFFRIRVQYRVRGKGLRER